MIRQPSSGRLSNATLAGLLAEVERPGYDRAAVKTGVVHLGIGAFHRAHQAVVFDDALCTGDLRWGVLGVSLRSPGVRDQLNPQDGLYSVVVRDGVNDRTRIIGAVQGVLVAPEDPVGVVAAMASPDVHLVTLTVTEKGYRFDPASGGLLTGDPAVAADLADLSRPRTAPGFLVAALAERRRNGLPPFTVVSCDNLPHNGDRVRAAALAMARAHDPALAGWIAADGAFPQTMVDRIVPATTPEDVDAQAIRLGVRDEGMVKTEPFIQWVVENQFAGPRPDLEKLGVQVTKDVSPFEDAKLRMLNGVHSALAYLGGLAGLTFMHQVVAEPAFAAYAERLWDETEATLTPPTGLDLMAYRHDLKARLANPALEHRTHQIAMDGSQKLPQRLLAGAALRLERGLPIDAIALAIAGWIRWQEGVTEQGERFPVEDPLRSLILSSLQGVASPADRASALIGLEQIVPVALARRPRFQTAVRDAVARLSEDGVRRSLGE